MLLIGQERRTNTPRTTLFAAIASLAILLMPALAMSQGHGAGGGGGGSGGPGGAGAGGHTSRDDGHSGGKGGSDPTRGKGQAPSSLSDVFRGMEDEASSKGSGKGGPAKGGAPTVTKKAPPAAKGPSVSKKGPPEGKGPAAKSQDVVTEEADGDEDSDRPEWAGGNPEENPHSGGGGGQPTTAGTKKGDLYGDLIMLVRNPETGEPVVEDGEYLICQDAACDPEKAVPTVDGEVPLGVTAIEVDFGRAAVARAPSKVIDKALTDALAKLTATDVVLGTDTAGRITYTVTIDDTTITNTIDSPLENLALYIDLMKGLVVSDDGSPTGSQTYDALGDESGHAGHGCGAVCRCRRQNRRYHDRLRLLSEPYHRHCGSRC